MFFVRILSVSLFFLTFGLAQASPVEGAGVAKRQDPNDLLATITTLKDSTGVILPQLNTLVANNEVTSDKVVPLINQLQAAFNTAQTSVTTLTLKSPSSHAVPSKEVIAPLLAEILIDVTKTLDAILLKDAIPALGGLLITLDITISGVLHSVEFLLAGVLVIVSSLVVDVAVLLKALSFDLVLVLLAL